MGFLSTWLFKEYFVNSLYRAFCHFVVTISGPIMPFPCPVFPICPIRALSLLSIHGCDWPLHFLQVDSPLSSPYATCHCTNLANFCLNMEAVCFSKNFISSSSVHRLITQTTRILLALKMVTQNTDGFWNVTPCSVVCVEVDQYFSGTCCSVIRVDDRASHWHHGPVS